MKCVYVTVGPVSKTEGHSNISSGEFGCGAVVDWWKVDSPRPGSGEVWAKNNHDPLAVADSRIGSDIHTVV